MNMPACPLCFSFDCKNQFTDPNHPELNVYLCNACGMGFLFPALSEEQTKAFTAESYDYGKAIDIPTVYAKYRQRILEQADFISRHTARPGKVLDIGCYTGDLLE